MPGAPRLPQTPVLSRRALLGAGALGAVALAGCSSAGSGSSGSAATGVAPGTTAPAPSGTASSSSTSPAATAGRAALSEPTDVATGLAVPWSGAVLPDGSVLVSERDTARVKRIPAGGGAVETVGTVEGVDPGGEGGLLGLAVDTATFGTRPVLYAYATAGSDNRVVRIALDGGRFGAQTPILTGIPKGNIHNGGRLKFGPDGFLYVTTGETGQTGNSQNPQSLAGKILRLTTSGEAAPGNPTAGSRVWSLGHRNVQGIAWGAGGRMWASEFGQNTWDELNVITPGANYGWPTVEGVAGRSGFVDPVRQWSTDEASPSGICVGPDGAVLMAALRGQGLWKVPVNGDGSTGEPEKLLDGEYGRLRDVFIGPDGNVWVITNNTSRGQVRDGDDRVVKLPQSLTG
jgi:glucose/arabinose dehydrogenase